MGWWLGDPLRLRVGEGTPLLHPLLLPLVAVPLPLALLLLPRIGVEEVEPVLLLSNVARTAALKAALS